MPVLDQERAHRVVIVKPVDGLSEVLKADTVGGDITPPNGILRDGLDEESDPRNYDGE